MKLALTPQQAAGASTIAATLLQEQAEGAPGEGAYALDLALEQAGCRQVRTIRIDERDVPDVRAALSAYVKRCGGSLHADERAAVDVLRKELRLSAHENVVRLAEHGSPAPVGIA